MEVFDVDDQHPDSVARLAASPPDRRRMLKLAGAAAVAAAAGFLARAEDAEARQLAVTITNLVNNLSVQSLVRDKTARGARRAAAQVCAAVEQMNSLQSCAQYACIYPGQ
jgi:hypothetical protein